MQNQSTIRDPALFGDADMTRESSGSSVAWAAIIGGAVAMTATTLILLPLGSALGFALASPWHRGDEAVKAFSLSSGLWTVLVQWLSAALGGYITGRLRAKWVGAHTHEVFFRDTIHGFLAWGLSAAVGAMILVSVAASFAGASTDHAMMHNANGANAQAIYVDRLFRSDRGPTSVSEQDRVEAGHLLMQAETSGNMADNDRVYLIHMVQDRTGLGEAEAQQRVDNIITQDKMAADTARKAAGMVALLLSLSMLIGAFVAAVGGALGGRDRDIHYHTGRFYE
jgi:hypothetical protein